MTTLTLATTTMERIRHFLSDPNDAPDYGYQDNAITGIGFWMMHGARWSISCWDRSKKAETLSEASALKAQAIFLAFITSPATFIGALLKAVGSQFPHKVENLTSDDIPATAPEKIDQIYDLVQIFDRICRDNHVEYSADGGTLLGAVREKGVIRWDDDADFIVMDKFKAQLLALKDRFKQQGIVFQDTGMDYFKLTFDKETLKNRYGVTSTEDAGNLDIFVMQEESDGMIRCKSGFYKDQFPKEYYHKEELQNMQDYAFGPPGKGLFVRGPAQPMRYLNTYYGSECMQYAIRTHSHLQIGPFALQLVNFSKTRYKIENPKYAVGNNWK